MMLIDAPEYSAGSAAWERYVETLSQHARRHPDPDVLAEIERAHRILALFAEDLAVDEAA